MNSQHPLSVDYLNQIAPDNSRPPFIASKKRLFIFIGILAVVLMIILSVIVSAIGTSKREPWERLSARLAATDTIVKSSSKSIKNGQLRTVNGNLQLYLANTKRDLAAPLLAAGVQSSKLPQSVLVAESSTKISERLEDARLNAKYDSTYAREMSYQLATILTLLKQLYTSSGNLANKAFLESAYNNLEPTQKTLADFSASNE